MAVTRPDRLDEFGEVYRANYVRLVRAARMLTGSKEIAEEVVQDAFVGLYPRFDTVGDPGGYLYRSVVNGCWASHRRRGVAERLGHLTAVAEVGPPEIDETWTLLERLAPRRRAAVVLRYYADLPVSEIARILECEEGTVKSMLHRALAELRKVVEP